MIRAHLLTLASLTLMTCLAGPLVAQETSADDPKPARQRAYIVQDRFH